MTRASVLARGRVAAEAGMIDACTIVEVTGQTTDRDTLVATDVTTPVYTGPCRVQEIFGFSRETTPSPDTDKLARYRVLQLPVETSEGVRVGQIVTITACVNDPDLVNVRMIVRDQSGKSEATARRIGVEEITG